MFAASDDDDQLEIPAFLRRVKGEKLPPWSAPPATAPAFRALAPRAAEDPVALAILAETEARNKRRKEARAAARRAKPSEEYLVGMTWDVTTAQWVPDRNASATAKAKAMQNFSKPQTVRSNARRAARALGVDPSKVVPVPGGGGYYFPLPDPSAGAGVPAAAPVKPKAASKKWAKAAAKRARPAKKAKAAKPAKKAKAAKPIKSGGKKRGPNGSGAELVATVAKMMRRKTGAPITEIVAATNWEKHTARARISVNVAATLAKGEEILRRREERGGEKVSVYYIGTSRQLEMQFPKDAG